MLKNIVPATVLHEVPPSLTLRTTYINFEHLPFLRPNCWSSSGISELEELFQLLLQQSVHSTGNMNQEAKNAHLFDHGFILVNQEVKQENKNLRYFERSTSTCNIINSSVQMKEVRTRREERFILQEYMARSKAIIPQNQKL